MSPRDNGTIREAADTAEPPHEEEWFAEIDGQWAVIRLGGKVRVMTVEHERDGNGYQQAKPVFLTEPDFRLLQKNRTVPGNKGPVPVADLWLTHPAHRTYCGLGLYPPPVVAPPGHFNLWGGWGVVPKKGRWPLLAKHIHDIIAGGNDTLADYVLDYTAYCFQHPDEKIDVALVLVGPQGSGKYAFGGLLCRLWGRHGMHLSKKEQVIGKFNGHLATTLFMFVDEAFFGGDKAGAATLKSLVADPLITIEPKFVNPFQMPNRLRTVFASNELHTLHLDINDRRYVCLELPYPWRAKGAQSRYFNELYAEINGSEGPAAFLYDMLCRDLSGFDIRLTPTTALKSRMKVESMSGTERWWSQMLSEGQAPWEWPDHQARKSNGWTLVPKSDLYGLYVEWARRQRNEFVADSNEAFWKKLRKLVELRDKRPKAGGERCRLVWVPSLDDSRGDFEKHVGPGGRFPWDERAGDAMSAWTPIQVLPWTWRPDAKRGSPREIRGGPGCPGCPGGFRKTIYARVCASAYIIQISLGHPGHPGPNEETLGLVRVQGRRRVQGQPWNSP